MTQPTLQQCAALQGAVDARKEAEDAERDARREKLIARGMARAARSRAYDAIQLGPRCAITGWEDFVHTARRIPT